MHPIFAKPGKPAVPILFVNAATFDGVVQKVEDREQVYIRAAGYQPSPAAISWCPNPMALWRAYYSASKPPTRR